MREKPKQTSSEQIAVFVAVILNTSLVMPTWIMPLIRQTPCFITTICESSGCKDLSSCLTSSILALWSLVNCSATILLDLPKEPITARESPTLPTYNVPLQITPTRQQDPIAAIVGFIPHDRRTRVRNPSSVAENALRRISSVIFPFSWASPMIQRMACRYY